MSEYLSEFAFHKDFHRLKASPSDDLVNSRDKELEGIDGPGRLDHGHAVT